ncbi:MAG: hypothetical protein ABIT92_04205 [Gammaproteobacteria bacterium]
MTSMKVAVEVAPSLPQGDPLAVNDSTSTVQIQSPLSEYTGIESLHSQQFSVGIFFFLVLTVMLFAGIVVAFMRGKNSLKSGEKWLFAWIFFGILVSIVFGALQLLGGYLF